MSEPIAMPEPTCQQCGKLCDIEEVVDTRRGGGDRELWCYCPTCDIETFHQLPTEMRNE